MKTCFGMVIVKTATLPDRCDRYEMCYTTACMFFKQNQTKTYIAFQALDEGSFVASWCIMVFPERVKGHTICPPPQR